ncbi:MAG: YggS family pyridoxal phosphate-dependent enzyme [Pseudomonadales bacterium]
MLERNFLSKNIAAVSQQIAAAEREPGQVTLLAATKTQSADTIRAAHALGIRNVGENYLAEALPKIQALTDLQLTWHFIGRIQSNKTQEIADHFDWVHCVDRAKIANRLSRQRSEAAPPLNVLIQVNIDADPDKAGIEPDDVADLAEHIISLPNLRLRGLMTILNQATDPGVGYRSMAQLAAAVGEQLTRRYGEASTLQWDCLSMGMSGDMQTAIEAGATIVRVGTALFGKRETGTSPA